MTEPAAIEIDNPLERLPRAELVALANRVLSVLASEHDDARRLAPVSRDELRQIEVADSLTSDQVVLLKPLAAWIASHDVSLTAAYPGPKPPLNHLHGCWSNFFSAPLNHVKLPRELPTGGSPSRFLGHDLRFPFGVPASALTPQHEYVGYFAERGFDLITFKTVRDRPWNPHAFPQWAFAPSVGEPIATPESVSSVIPTLDPGAVPSVDTTSLVNSFGVPSLAIDQWKIHVDLARKRLRRDQVLIVSVMGSPEEADSHATLISQFSRAASEAEDAGADVIELNLSCPNTGSHQLLCFDPELSASVVAGVRRELSQDTPLIVKISYMDEPHLRRLVKACGPQINGIVAINALSVPARRDSQTAFFPGRINDAAGLSGIAIRDLGLQVTRNLVEIRQTLGASPDDWVVVGVGGVMTPADYQAYRDAGADAVQSCSGAWLNHRLALETREYVLSGGGPEHTRPSSEPSVDQAVNRQNRVSKPSARRRSWLRKTQVALEAIGSGGVSVITDRRSDGPQD